MRKICRCVYAIFHFKCGRQKFEKKGKINYWKNMENIENMEMSNICLRVECWVCYCLLQHFIDLWGIFKRLTERKWLAYDTVLAGKIAYYHIFHQQNRNIGLFFNFPMTKSLKIDHSSPKHLKKPKINHQNLFNISF